MKRPFRCPIIVTAAVVGASAVAIALYYYWSQRKTEKVVEEVSKPSEASSSTASTASAGSEPRADGGKEVLSEQNEALFSIRDENVREVCERLFLQQMDLGEAFLADEGTMERGAMHLSNAIALTGEAEPLLKVLRKSVPAANFACIQKYMPTAEMRIQQLLQDELNAETISEHFAIG